jgi:hypothetical protein
MTRAERRLLRGQWADLMLEHQSGMTRREDFDRTDWTARLSPRCDQFPKPGETPVTRCLWPSLDHLVQNLPKIKRNTSGVVRDDRVHQCQRLPRKLGADRCLTFVTDVFVKAV